MTGILSDSGDKMPAIDRGLSILFYFIFLFFIFCNSGLIQFSYIGQGSPKNLKLEENDL